MEHHDYQCRHEDELREHRLMLSQLEAQAAQVAADHHQWLKRQQKKMEEEQELHRMRVRSEKEHLARLNQLEDQVLHPLHTIISHTYSHTYPLHAFNTHYT